MYKAQFIHLKVLVFCCLWQVFFLVNVDAQIGHPDCDPGVPHFDVDMTGDPSGSWQSPSVRREDNCCDANQNERCVSFTISLDDDAVGFYINISGAPACGSFYTQIDCDEEISACEPICVDGGETYNLSLCKPGSNQNVYTIESIPGLIVGDPISAQVNCDYSLSVSGSHMIESTVVWQDITSGTGEYNSYLSCTMGCFSPEFTPAYNSPEFIEYEVCAQFSDQGGNCSFPEPLCDTVLVQVVFLPDVTFTPFPPIFCADEVEEVTAILSDTPST